MGDTKLAQEISLDDAVSGMLLAKPLLEKSGACLLPAGAELSERSLQALRQRGVLQVTIARTSDNEVGADVEQSLKRLDTLFRNSMDSEPNRYLMTCLRRYRMGGTP